MNEIKRLGADYGFTFNNKKLEILPNNVEEDAYNYLGQLIFRKDRIAYLGSILSVDVCVYSEVGRRIGAA